MNVIKLDKKYTKFRRDIYRVIWQSLESVHPENALSKHVRLKWEDLYINDEVINLEAFDNIYVIGADRKSVV